MRVKIFFDGAARNNPRGPSAGAAVLVWAPDPSKNYAGATLTVHGQVFEGTNNVAEWTGLILGLQEAVRLGVRDVDIYGDSKLVVLQARGEWRVKKPHLMPLYETAKALLDRLGTYSLNWIPREENTLADRASNEAIDNPRKTAR